MREILFRGKRIRDGEWVDGNLFIDDKGEKCEILVGYTNYRIAYEVDPKTIGQWTGLVDKNGVKIFEWDLVTIENTKKQGMPACVRWEQENCQFVASRIGYQPINLGCFEDKTQWVVIGNIHDKAVEE